jgi:large subunit ribosomal protein L17
LQTIESAHKLFDEIAPKITRDSGYLRIKKTVNRRGDNAQLAIISFVDDLSAKPVTKDTPAISKAKEVKKASIKKESK